MATVAVTQVTYRRVGARSPGQAKPVNVLSAPGDRTIRGAATPSPRTAMIDAGLPVQSPAESGPLPLNSLAGGRLRP